jgi:hypothetical protein
MSETLKATLLGTLIIAICMLISVKVITNTLWDISHEALTYNIQAQTGFLKALVKIEGDVAQKSSLGAASKVQEVPQLKARK